MNATITTSHALEPQSRQGGTEDLGNKAPELEGGRLHNGTSCPENELVAIMINYQSGELDAFVRLWDSLALEIRDFLARKGSAEDELNRLLESSFLQMHRSRHTYRPPHAVRNWAFDIARYTQAVDSDRTGN